MDFTAKNRLYLWEERQRPGPLSILSQLKVDFKGTAPSHRKTVCLGFLQCLGSDLQSWERGTVTGESKNPEDRRRRGGRRQEGKEGRGRAGHRMSVAS